MVRAQNVVEGKSEEKEFFLLALSGSEYRMRTVGHTVRRTFFLP